jgi:lipoprotein-releasing system ATP-binding protein
MNNPIIACEALSKTYYEGTAPVHVLKGVDFSIFQASRMAIVGPSGSGKSTLLHLLGGLDNPSQGCITINGFDWQQLKEKKRCQLRNRELGFIYQFHHLLPEFTALENVAMPLLLRGTAKEEAIEKAQAILGKVGLKEREQHKPSQLSGGERQRTAIARALVHKPKCVFADEPTGNLDRTTAFKIFDLMLELNEEGKTALVMVTHDMELARRMNNIWTLQGGQLQEM